MKGGLKLRVEIFLWSIEDGGRTHPIVGPGYICLAKGALAESNAHGCEIAFASYPVNPGERADADLIFIAGETAEAIFRKLGVFYLFEGGRQIGVAKVEMNVGKDLRPFWKRWFRMV